MSSSTDSAEATWATYAARDPSETIRLDDPAAQATGLEALARGEQELRLGETLGVGGMGVVRVASQVRLGREVAVKSPRSDRSSQRASRALLQEAWITGALEHPNIVPIHDIIFTDAQPHIVMKRITGTLWRDLLESPELLRQTHGVEDTLDWHLNVLLQVCRALEFAHSRQILHRDLKPSNVMIGAYGEVYLLDWGIAVSLRRDPSGRFPQPRAGSVVGTPRYMAPEMARGQPPTVRTDVYLLGSLLYRILNGHPPHQGELTATILAQIDTLDVSTTEAPAELVQVLARAMHLEPERRFPQVADFRLGLQSYLEHRASIEVAEQARQRLAQLHGLLTSVEGSEAHRAAVYEAYSACRFGFREALRTWPENVSAVEGLEQATRAMFQYEIRERDARSAAVHLSNLRVVEPPLEQALAALRAARAQEYAKQQQLEQQHDTAVGRRTRSFFAASLGTVWMLGPVITWLIWGPLSMFGYAIYSSAVTAFIFGLVYWARESMTATLLNRTLTVLLLVGASTQSVLDWFMWSQGDTPADANQLKLLIDASYVLCAALLIERRLVPSAVAYGLCFGVVAFAPGAERVLLSLCGLVLAGNALVIWYPGPRKG